MIVDFGCCLVDRLREFVFFFYIEEIDRGGNFILMVLEVND